jgi:hypothetical protein
LAFLPGARVVDPRLARHGGCLTPAVRLFARQDATAEALNEDQEAIKRKYYPPEWAGSLDRLADQEAIKCKHYPAAPSRGAGMAVISSSIRTIGA